MKQSITLLFIALLFLVKAPSASGQVLSAEGCDGFRYAADVFDSVKVTTVQFGENINELGLTQKLYMDVYEPVGDNVSKRPVIVWAHGGSFVLGARGDEANTCIGLAKKGYIAATVDYRLWPLAFGFPDSSQILGVVIKSMGDMKAAIRYFRKDAAGANQFKADPNFILVGGISAGAIAALHVADIDANDSLSADLTQIIANNGGLDGNSGNDGYSSSVVAAISLSGALHKQEWLSAGDPPFVSMHGTADQVVPYNHGIANGIISVDGDGLLYLRAQQLGIESYLMTVPGGGHTDIYTNSNYASYLSEFYYNAFALLHGVLCPDIALGASSGPATAALNAFPNPAREQLTLDLQGISGAYTVSVYDVFGKMIQRRSNLTAPSCVLHKGDLGTGTFVVQITPENNPSKPLIAKILFL